MLTRAEIESKLKQLKPELAEKFHVSSIGYFGSYANDKQNVNSDIDLLVEFSEPIGWKFFTLERFLEQTFGIPVDLVTKNALKDRIKEKYSNIPWEEMYRLRNRISHEYFGIDYEILWDITNKHLPQNLLDILEVIKNER